MNYEDMSDFEINVRVAEHLPLRIHENQSASVKCKPSGVLCDDLIETYEFNPCNSPSDTWPIIVDNKIAIAPAKATAGMWFGSSADGSLCAPMDSNPLRAAMIVFLIMNDGES